MQDAFDAVNQAAPWYGQVKSVELDGKAVIVWTTLGESDADTALSMCEAAYSAGETSGTDFVSVAVRTEDNSTTLASRNKLANHTACQA